MDALTYVSMQVIIDNQAWLYAAHTVGTDAPDDEFLAAMTDWKRESAALIEEGLQQLIDEAEAADEQE